MKTFSTGRLALASALLAKGCKVAFPPYTVRSFGDGLLDFHLQDNGELEALKSEALSGTLEVNWQLYEQKRAMLVELVKRESNHV